MSSVTIKSVTKSFGESQVLKEFTNTFADGEFITLLGPSGCGKTTMLRIIAGFEHPTSGEVWIGDQLVSGGKTFVPPERRGIGMVFQSYAVWPHMNVFRNVAYPLTIAKTPKAEIESRVRDALAIVHLSQYADRMPSQLSGGQQQRVALARALVAKPGLLLLDEPLSNLDAKLRESMRFEIKEIQRETGITVVYVTHDQTEAMAMSDRVILINNGVIQQDAPPAEIYNRPANPFVADFLGKVVFLKGTADTDGIALDGTGQSVANRTGVSGPVLLAVRPERISMEAGKKEGALAGTLEQMYYLGDTSDCRVRVGEQTIRVIADPFDCRDLAPGDPVSLSLHQPAIFEGEAALEEVLRIRT